VFYRHVGLDPDAYRVPIEAAVVARLIAGQFKSENVVDDALTIALVETGVPIWALDAATLDGPIGLRGARRGERLGQGEQARPLPEGRLVVADGRAAVAILFGDVASEHFVTKSTRRMTLFALQVAGVPSIHVEESLFMCADAIVAG
jgi:DNA/RNA-binding domain of Phe-tRNA-synthetase-like protein